MNNILNEFNFNVTNLVEKFLKKLENGLSNFTDDLNDKLMKLGRDITSYTINFLFIYIFLQEVIAWILNAWYNLVSFCCITVNALFS